MIDSDDDGIGNDDVDGHGDDKGCDDVNGGNDDSDSSNNDDRVNDGKHDDDGYNNGHVGYCTPYLHVLCIVFVQIYMKLKLRLFLP